VTVELSLHAIHHTDLKIHIRLDISQGRSSKNICVTIFSVFGARFEVRQSDIFTPQKELCFFNQTSLT
jgi:hypothetical protein